MKVDIASFAFAETLNLKRKYLDKVNELNQRNKLKSQSKELVRVATFAHFDSDSNQLSPF